MFDPPARLLWVWTRFMRTLGVSLVHPRQPSRGILVARAMGRVVPGTEVEGVSKNPAEPVAEVKRTRRRRVEVRDGSPTDFEVRRRGLARPEPISRWISKLMSIVPRGTRATGVLVAAKKNRLFEKTRGASENPRSLGKNAEPRSTPRRHLRCKLFPRLRWLE